MKLRLLALVLSLFTLAGGARAAGMGTAFSYQGRLADNGQPASGAYDLRFSLYDAPNGGAPLGAPLAFEDIAVVNGHFAVTLDFGAGAFPGAARWVEIAVRAGSSSGDFTPLAPRIAITPSPYALLAASVAPASIGPNELRDGAVTAAKLAPGAAVKSLNGITDAVQLSAGANVTIARNGNSLELTASGTPGPQGPPGVPGERGPEGPAGPPGSGGNNWNIAAGLQLDQDILSVVFGGSGAQTVASRVDHDHFGQAWQGEGEVGLRVLSTRTNTFAVQGIATNGTAALGVHGQSPEGIGVFGESVTGGGIYGSSQTGTAIYAQSASGSLLEAYGGTGLALQVNNAGDVRASGRFVGDGSLLTGLTADQISSGRIPRERLPENLADLFVPFGTSLAGSSDQPGFGVVNNGPGFASVGMQAESPNGVALKAVSNGGTSVFADNAGPNGILYRGDGPVGPVFRVTTDGMVGAVGFRGGSVTTTNSEVLKTAVEGGSDSGFGVAGFTTTGTGVYGSNGDSDDVGHAAYFAGKVRVTRSLLVDGGISSLTGFQGSGAALIDLDAGALSRGKIPRERLPDELFGGGGGGGGPTGFNADIFGSGASFGLRVDNQSPDFGSGIIGVTQSGQGGANNHAGVHGINNSTDFDRTGFGVFGETSTGAGAGVGGSASGPAAAGVLGKATALTGDGVRGVHEGPGFGAGVMGQTLSAQSQARAVYGLASADQGNTIGVLGVTRSLSPGASGVVGRTPNGSGVMGTSDTGFGIDGETTSGTGVYGSNGDSDTVGHAAYFSGRARVTKSLTVDGNFVLGGLFRVPGAGINTSTAAFVHQVTASSRFETRDPNASDPNVGYSRIDHPLCNNDPNAILIVTAQHDSFEPPFVSVVYDADGSLAASSFPPVERIPGRWLIRGVSISLRLISILPYARYTTRQFPAVLVGNKYNILVIKP